jgi:hypothetical protein
MVNCDEGKLQFYNSSESDYEEFGKIEGVFVRLESGEIYKGDYYNSSHDAAKFG